MSSRNVPLPEETRRSAGHFVYRKTAVSCSIVAAVSCPTGGQRTTNRIATGRSGSCPRQPAQTRSSRPAPADLHRNTSELPFSQGPFQIGARLLIKISCFSVTSVTIALDSNSNSPHRKHKDPSEVSSKLRQASLTFSAQGPFGPFPSVYDTRCPSWSSS